jgi:predicted phage terminase large subunit-like protein
MVKAAWFENYAPNERPDKFDRIVQSWDTANKASELSDFSVCTTWGIKDKDFYLLHVLRKRMEYPELKRAVREQAQAFVANVVLIEDKASGTQLIQELIHEGLHAVTRYQPQSDKVMRMHAQTAMIEHGFVHLPKEAAWLAEYLHELTVFPKGKHDDQVDSTAQMLDCFKRGGQEPRDWMWQMHKEAQARGPQPARPEPLSVMARRLGILRSLY